MRHPTPKPVKPKAGPPPLPPRCDGCGAKHPNYGLGPPLVKRQQWFCRTCIELQPDTQARLAEAAIEAAGDTAE